MKKKYKITLIVFMLVIISPFIFWFFYTPPAIKEFVPKLNGQCPIGGCCGECYWTRHSPFHDLLVKYGFIMESVY